MESSKQEQESDLANVKKQKQRTEEIPSVHKASMSTVNEETKDDEPTPVRQLPVPENQWVIAVTPGNRHSFLVFRSTALAGYSDESIHCKPGFKLHMTFKVFQAESKLLSKILECHGITEVPAHANDFNLMWTGSHPKPGTFRALTTHQRVNHFPRSYELTRKDRLYKNIDRMQRTKGQRNFDFIPQTFIMPGDYKELCSTHYRLRGPWIVKPVASSRGRGIFIVENPTQVPLDEPVVVAKYVSNPLLIDGHKCDLRLYVAVTSYDPLLVYIYEEGLVRFATVKYDSSHKQLWNPCMHLCNYSINKYHSDYVRSDDPCAENVGHKWTLSALLRHLKAQGQDTVQLMANIEDLIVKSILSSANSVISACQMFVPNQANCFELFGFDILIDENLKPWLLEINLSPSLGCDSPLDVRLKSSMLADLLTLVGLPAVDPVLKAGPTTSNIKPRLGACRRVRSADGLGPGQTQRTQRPDRLSNSTLCLTAEEARLVRTAKAQFERRGGWVRIFPTAESWTRYSQYLDVRSSPSLSPATLPPQGYNHLLHCQLFPDVSRRIPSTRHDRYERQLQSSHRDGLVVHRPVATHNQALSSDELKKQVCDMLQGGRALTQEEARRTFAQYLQCVLKKISRHSPEQDAHVEVVLKFLQKASSYLRTPFSVRAPSSKLAGKDRAAIVAKQLHDFLYLYNRETELYIDTADRYNCVPRRLFSHFLDSAREVDLEEVLALQTFRHAPASCQGLLLKCLPAAASRLHRPKSSLARR